MLTFCAVTVPSFAPHGRVMLTPLGESFGAPASPPARHQNNALSDDNQNVGALLRQNRYFLQICKLLQNSSLRASADCRRARKNKSVPELTGHHSRQTNQCRDIALSWRKHIDVIRALLNDFLLPTLGLVLRYCYSSFLSPVLIS